MDRTDGLSRATPGAVRVARADHYCDRYLYSASFPHPTNAPKPPRIPVSCFCLSLLTHIFSSDVACATHKTEENINGRTGTYLLQRSGHHSLLKLSVEQLATKTMRQLLETLSSNTYQSDVSSPTRYCKLVLCLNETAVIYLTALLYALEQTISTVIACVTRTPRLYLLSSRSTVRFI